MASIAISYRMPPKEFEKQYKEHLSDFSTWEQREHAEEWTLHAHNIGAHLSIDEVAISDGELYTLLTNKAAHGKQGALVASVQGTKVSDVAAVLRRIPELERLLVTEVTLDMSPAMEAIVGQCFPRARVTTDRFHVQQLISEAVQEVRMKERRKAMQEENEALKKAREEKRSWTPVLYENGDSKRQLLARSHHLLFMPESKWRRQQKERAEILFTEFPEIKKAYDLSMMFRSCYEYAKDKETGRKQLGVWYAKVVASGIDEFLVPGETIKLREETILNYFVSRSTNASAESFNAKLKNFRSLVRGVTDKVFFLYRVCKLYA